ncbi:MAG TPA: hypothetical protein VD838_23320 [Anaeromyxobacteraceae bacterium]|nr:hypothetical protein [Anaeromyxobacteraceae bacterium]
MTFRPTAWPRAAAGLTPHRRHALAVVALAAAALACASGPRGRTSDFVERRFTLPEQGTLVLRAPADWTLEEATPEEPVAMGIRVTPKDGSFVALLTPYWDPDAPQAPADVETAQTAAELARRKAREGSVEEEIALEELVGEGVHGYWFTATDKSLADREPGKDEWRALLQGAAAVGRLVLIFEMLDNGPGPHRAAVLDLVRRARHEPPRDGAPPVPPRPGGEKPEEPDAEAFEPDPSMETVPLQVELPGRGWSALVDLPGFAATAPRTSADGRSVLVLAQHPRTGLVASVLLVEGGDARDPTACRARDLDGIRRAVPDLQGLRLSEAAGAVRAEYVAPTLRGETAPQVNAHEWRARDGVCVHLHVSKMGPGEGDRAAIEEVLASLRFGEAL